MPELDLAHCLVVGISSRSLFDLEEENKIYETAGVEAFKKVVRDANIKVD